MRTTAPAKINLHLGVSRACDEQGYHLVETVMCPLDLADVVEVALLGDGDDRRSAGAGAGPRIELVCTPDPVSTPQDNLAWKAAAALGRRLGRTDHVRITIEKHIPSQAGLGGGSSDAAATLRCLAALWGVSPTAPEVVEVARGLGADVPFFLYEATCHLTGRGDVFVERLPLPCMSVVLVKPPVGVSTPAAYRAFDKLGGAAPALDGLLAALREGAGPTAIAGLAANNLQPAACVVEPQVAEALAWLASAPEALGAPLLCGSGACCALFVADDDAACALVRRARARNLWAQPAHTLPSAPSHDLSTT